ncbi:MAG: YcxB family protein [Terracidiphilus sp.]|jgi:hypothetical protein
MKVEYEPTFADYKAAYTTYRKKTRASAAIHLTLFKIFPAATTLFIILTLVLARNGHVDPLVYGLASSLLTVTLFAFFNRFSYIRRQVKNLFPVSAKDRRIITEINEENIVTLIPRAIRTEYFWESISWFLSSPQVDLLYVSPERFILIPNRVLTKEQQTSLREIIVRKGIKTKSC